MAAKRFGCAVLMATGCTGQTVCGPVFAQDPVEIRRIESCETIEGELIIAGGFRDVLSLPNLVEVRDGIAISEVGLLDLPNLERVGYGVSRGDLAVREVFVGVNAPQLRSLGRGAFAEDDDTFLNEHGVYVRAEGDIDIDLGALENPGELFFDNIGRTPVLGAVRSGGVSLMGSMPSTLTFPMVIGTLRVTGTTNLTDVTATMPAGQLDIEISGTRDLQTVTAHTSTLDAVSINDNADLQRVLLPDLQALELLVVEDNASEVQVDLGAVVCPESHRWQRNGSEEPETLAACD